MDTCIIINLAPVLRGSILCARTGDYCCLCLKMERISVTVARHERSHVTQPAVTNNGRSVSGWPANSEAATGELSSLNTCQLSSLHMCHVSYLQCTTCRVSRTAELYVLYRTKHGFRLGQKVTVPEFWSSVLISGQHCFTTIGIFLPCPRSPMITEFSCLVVCNQQ